jgi:hypothetical protein
MFVFDRSAFAVLLPLALLAGVVLLSDSGANRAQARPAPQESARDSGADQAVAANLPSR